MARIYLEGDTYPVKEQLRAMGCRWDSSRRAWFTEDVATAESARAILAPKPLFNSPPPADLGTAGPEELATRFGRTAVAGAKVRSFSEYGLPKGDNGTPDGTLHTIKGHRYLQVGRTGRRYLSRDMLEDFDLFGEEPGGSYQWDGVEVEPTDEEQEADRRAEAERAAAKAAFPTWLDTAAPLYETDREPKGYFDGSDCAAVPVKDHPSVLKADRPYPCQPDYYRVLGDGRWGFLGCWDVRNNAPDAENARRADDWRKQQERQARFRAWTATAPALATRTEEPTATRPRLDFTYRPRPVAATPGVFLLENNGTGDAGIHLYWRHAEGGSWELLGGYNWSRHESRAPESPAELAFLES